MLFLTMTLGVFVLPLQFADAGWFYRYEAYLMVLSLLALGVWLVREFAGPDPVRDQPRPWHRARRAGVAVLVLASGVPLGWAGAARLVPLACHNVYEQQYQMGRFMRRFYTGQGVALNDIGAVDYLADVRLFDTYGLASMDVLRAKRAQRYDHTVVERVMAQLHVRVVAIYDDWPPRRTAVRCPAGRPVGQWTLGDNVICASPPSASTRRTRRTCPH